MASGEDEARRAWAAFIAAGEDHPAAQALGEASTARALSKDAVLLHESDRDDGVFLVGSGALRSVRNTAEGQEIWLTDHGAGELIGEIAALTGQGRTSSTIALGPSIVFAVARADFLAACTRHGILGLALARLLATRLSRTSTQVAELVAMSVQHRLHQELIRLSNPGQNGGAVIPQDLAPSVTELGQRIHATREATSRALRDLEARGLIARSGDAWVLPGGTGKIPR
jgi:CRP/FNR family cyclic AMP-dependent transcriptional regulator